MMEAIFFNCEENLVEIRFSGQGTLKSWQRALNEAIRCMGEHGISRLLIDTSNQDKLPKPVELFVFGSSLPRFFLGTVAIALIPSPKNYHSLAFLETVSCNRGYSVQLLETRSRAIAWLKEWKTNELFLKRLSLLNSFCFN